VDPRAGLDDVEKLKFYKVREFSVYATLSVVNRVSPRKICVLEDGRMTETCSTVK
jgi:hypothetical protein